MDSAFSCILFFFCLTLLITFCCFKAYEKQKQMQKSTTQLESRSEEREKVEKFKITENSIVSKPINPFMFGNYLLILKVSLFTKALMATCLLWLFIHIVLVLKSIYMDHLIRVEVYFVYQTMRTRRVLGLLFFLLVCKGNKYDVLTSWKT